jgi:DNA polymerase-4
MTRATSLPHFVADKAEFGRLARALLEAELPLRGPIRLMGLALSGLEGAEDDKPARDEAQLRLL